MNHPRSIAVVDLGASSGRVAMATWDGVRGRLDEVHRFGNAPVSRDGHLFWDVDRLWDEISCGVRAAAQRAGGPLASIGVDGWAVDYALLDESGDRVAPVYCYRDARNPPAMRLAHSLVPRERLYAITGIQFLPFNTLYQLRAHIAEHPHEWDRAHRWLNLPEYVLFRLSGVTVAEYTNATHTQMLEAPSRCWSREIAGAFGLDLAKFPPVVAPGTILGTVRGELAGADAHLRDAKVIAPACHDTGSAIAGIPFGHDDLGFISSGTWSLVGTVLDAPVLTAAARDAGFTNEGGIGRTIRFLTNVIGLWLLQQCVEEWRGEGVEATEALLASAASRSTFDGPWFDADNDTFLEPGGMRARIDAALELRGFAPSASPAETAAAIFRSLARRYARVLRDAQEVSGKRFDAVCVAGGGVRNRALTAWTREATGLRVIEGPAESALIGNAAVQIAALEGTTAAADVQSIARAFLPS
ncbi:MAG TPA: rhamnulokinase family protein [Candidatus Elarobacter sp.]|nr:rhamnulokinase family protein [Candidatus Elarobacter sp.]